MTNFNDVKQLISGMMGMKFGSYNASVNGLEKKYKHGICHPQPSNVSFTTWDQDYVDDNNKVVATAFNIKTDTEEAYTMYDRKTGRTYYTGWQDKNKSSDKFTGISFFHGDACYEISDSNHNGVIDENDTVTRKGEKEESIKILDLLT